MASRVSNRKVYNAQMSSEILEVPCGQEVTEVATEVMEPWEVLDVHEIQVVRGTAH